MTNPFSKLRRSKLKRNGFDLSYPHQFTANEGQLVPAYLQEVVPGDYIRIASGLEVRTQPLVTPLYGNINVEIRYFYVPNRILWDNFGAFLMDQHGDRYDHPYLPFEVGADSGPGTLADFIGVPTNIEDRINALPFRAYNLIYNEYFRDQNLQDPVPVNTNDGMDSLADYQLLNACWSKDYFTSALPFTQAGKDVNMHNYVRLVDQGWDPEMQPPLRQGRGPKIWDVNQGPGEYISPTEYARIAGLRSNVSGLNDADWPYPINGGDLLFTSGTGGSGVSSQSVGGHILIDPNDTLEVNLSLLELRRASAVQRFLERSALVGSNRYADWLRGMFGVDIGDKTLQRPQYLGGGKVTINVSPVEQNSESANTPQGTLAGKGYTCTGFKTNHPLLCTEHGWVMGLVYVRPQAYYSMGLDRSLSKSNRFDYFMPGFEHLGEQEILKKELYALTGNNQYARTNEDTFGYQERYAELKWHRPKISGEFKNSLASWVMPRQLGTMHPETDPGIALNGDFVDCHPNLDNNFAVSGKVFPHFLFNAYHLVKALRPLHYFPDYKLI